MPESEYNVSLSIDITASSFEEAAEDFTTYLRDSVFHVVTVTRLGPNGRAEDVTEVEVRR
jgi:hypothetical protein